MDDSNCWSGVPTYLPTTRLQPPKSETRDTSDKGVELRNCKGFLLPIFLLSKVIFTIHRLETIFVPMLRGCKCN